MENQQITTLNVYQYQCVNDGKMLWIWCPICPHCGIDNSSHLIEGGYYERLQEHLKKIDPDFNNAL